MNILKYRQCVLDHDRANHRMSFTKIKQLSSEIFCYKTDILEFKTGNF